MAPVGEMRAGEVRVGKIVVVEMALAAKVIGK